MQRHFKFLAVLGIGIVSLQVGSPAAAQDIDHDRWVTFRGQRMRCGDLYRLSEDQQFAGQFQSLRRQAIKWRGIMQNLRHAIERGDRWNRINSMLRQGVQVVSVTAATWEAVHTGNIMPIVKTVVSEVSHLPEPSVLGAVGAGLRRLADSNEREWKRIRSQLLSQVSTAEQYANQFQSASNGVINTLIEAKRVLNRECRRRQR